MANAAETLWSLVKDTIPGVRLGGICAHKPGYHWTRDGVLNDFGPDYSTRLPIDQLGPGNVCSACDVTPQSTAQMILYCTRLRDACLSPTDDRTRYIREFIGTVNGSNVACWIHNDELDDFEFDGSRDNTHLWHIHISFFRKWAAEPLAGEAIASVINGESYEDWTARMNGGQNMPTPITVWSGVTIGPVGRKLAEILSYYPKPGEIYITSAYRDESGSHHSGLSYGGSPTAAIDIGFGGTGQPARGRDVAKWLYDNFWDLTVELIHTTPFDDDDGFYVKNQVRYPGGGPYAGTTASQHADHVHFASSDALADRMLAKLRATTPAPQPNNTPGSRTVQVGSVGADVLWLQEKLGVDNSTGPGEFGPRTEAAVKAYQAANGLDADGIVGPLTWAKLLAAPVPVPVPVPVPEPPSVPVPEPVPGPVVCNCECLTEAQVVAAVKRALREGIN